MKIHETKVERFPMTENHHVLHIMSNEWRKTCKTRVQLFLMIVVPFVTILFLFWGLHYIRSATEHYKGLVFCQSEIQLETLSTIMDQYDSFEMTLGDEEEACEKVHNGKADVAIVLDSQSISIIYDSTLISSSQALQDSSQLASEAVILMEDVSIYESFLTILPQIVSEDVSTDEEKLDSGLEQIAGTMGMILFLSMASNAMTLSSRSITGEKERQTFDSLVLCPTPLRKILLGKILIMDIQILLAGLAGMFGVFLGMCFWDRETFHLVAEKVRGDAWWIVIILLILFSASMLITGVFAIIASAFPETKKTALFGSLGMIIISFASMAPTYFKSGIIKYIPIANFSLILTDACKHQFDVIPIFSSTGISIVLIILCTVLANRLWERSHE